jgi:TRAP-type C4-dicarboxylate transport system substrate-binding protein
MKRLISVILFGVALLIFVAFPLPVLASEKPIRIKLATHWPVRHDMNNVMVEFARDIGRESNGQIQVSYYPAGMLAGSGSKYQKVRTGVCDITNIHLSQHPGAFPLSQLTTLPFLFEDGTEAGWVLNQMLDSFAANLEEKNVKLLFMVGDPNFQILLKDKKIETVSDFKGMRLKSGGFADEALKVWGAVPVRLKHGDMYLAMQRGVVDGIVFPVGAARSFKLDEVSKYVCKMDFFSYHLFMGMNLDTWKRLTPDLKEAVMRASRKAAYLSAFHYQNTDGATFDIFNSQGVEVYSPSKKALAAMQSSVASLKDKMVKDLEAKGLPGRKTMARMEKLMKAYRENSLVDKLKPSY